MACRVIPLNRKGELAQYHEALRLNVNFWYLRTGLAQITGHGLDEARARWDQAIAARDAAGVCGSDAPAAPRPLEPVEPA